MQLHVCRCLLFCRCGERLDASCCPGWCGATSRCREQQDWSCELSPAPLLPRGSLHLSTNILRNQAVSGQSSACRILSQQKDLCKKCVCVCVLCFSQSSSHRFMYFCAASSKNEADIKNVKINPNKSFLTHSPASSPPASTSLPASALQAVADVAMATADCRPSAEKAVMSQPRSRSPDSLTGASAEISALQLGGRRHRGGERGMKSCGGWGGWGKTGYEEGEWRNERKNEEDVFVRVEENAARGKFKGGGGRERGEQGGEEGWSYNSATALLSIISFIPSHAHVPLLFCWVAHPLPPPSKKTSKSKSLLSSCPPPPPFISSLLGRGGGAQ